MTTKKYVLISATVVSVTALLLHSLGRIWISQSGKILLWVGSVNTAEDSQQLSDWYSASHFIHGILFFAVLFLILRRTSIGFRFTFATILECGWEILENSPIIINRYREATIAIGYTGDSVLNSMSDITFMALGFLFARYLPWWVSVLIVVFLELFVGYMIHDNLFLNVLMLVHPVDAVKVWQASL